jgi:hypothetical protein
MMARRGNSLLKGLSRGTAKQNADVAPGFFVVKSVEIVACRYAGLAACAGVEINCKCVLFAFFRF